MKNKTFSTIFILLAAITSAFVFTACPGKDTTSPQVYLQGDNPYYITLNDNYIEYGFKVNDNRDDSLALEIEIKNPIDTLEEDILNVDGHDYNLGIGATVEVGEYIVTYTVTDVAGNSTVVERTVIVENSLKKYARIYDAVKENLTNPEITYSPYEMEIEFHDNLNNRLWLPRFSNFDFFNINVYIDIIGDSIFIPLQTFPDDNNYIVEGIDDDNNGFAGLFNRSNYKFDITYTASSASTSAQEYHELMTKQ